MLDEYKEFDEYTHRLEDVSFQARRLKKGNVAEWEKQKDGYICKFTGVPRALIIIARHAYYSAKLSETDTIYLLKLWCGFEVDASLINIGNVDAYHNIVGWLPKYLELLLETEGKEDKDREKYQFLIKDLRENKKNLWNRSAFQKFGSLNDENAIYFENIVASAVQQGPLKKYYLTFDKDPMDNFHNSKGKDLYDGVLKLVACHLLNQIPESEYSVGAFAEYSNWVHKGCSDAGKVTTRAVPKCTYNIGDRKGHVIVDVEYLDPDKKRGPLLRIDREWQDQYVPRLVDVAELSTSLMQNKYVFQDMGCSELLKKVLSP